MISFNDKGGNNLRVNLIKRGKGTIQHNMLKDTLIKKSENYILQSERFLTNNLPGIMQHTKQLIEIRPRYDNGMANAGFPANHFLGTRNIFTARKIFSVACLCESLAQFMSHFNFGLNMCGANFSLFFHPNLFVNSHIRFTNNLSYDLRNDIPPNQVVKHISLGLDADGSLQLVMSSQFLSNFFIVLDPVFAKQVGFPEKIYSGVNDVGNVVMSNQPKVVALLDEFDDFDIASTMQTGRSVISTNSIFRIDDRISIDVEISLPVVRTIDVHEKKEKQTFVLARYNVTDYVSVDTVCQQRGGFLLTKTIMQDKLSTGFTDLVGDYPGTHTIELKNGNIRELDIRLVLRYKDFKIINNILKYSIATKLMELEDDGLYDLLLSFNKRV